VIDELKTISKNGGLSLTFHGEKIVSPEQVPNEDANLSMSLAAGAGSIWKRSLYP
jgi:hypothetical protein